MDQSFREMQLNEFRRQRFSSEKCIQSAGKCSDTKSSCQVSGLPMTEKQLNISAGKFQAVWLTIKIPAAVRPGTYLGEFNGQMQPGRAENTSAVNNISIDNAGSPSS